MKTPVIELPAVVTRAEGLAARLKLLTKEKELTHRRDALNAERRKLPMVRTEKGLYASQRVLLKTFSDRLCIYHGEKLIATHTRSYDRYRDFENPNTPRNLLSGAAQPGMPNCC
jgi:hypothetical protein